MKLFLCIRNCLFSCGITKNVIYVQVNYKLEYIVGPRKGTRSPSVSTKKKSYTEEQYSESLKTMKINWMRYVNMQHEDTNTRVTVLV